MIACFVVGVELLGNELCESQISSNLSLSNPSFYVLHRFSDYPHFLSENHQHAGRWLRPGQGRPSLSGWIRTQHLTHDFYATELDPWTMVDQSQGGTSG
jgi:hypothetical protein